MRSKERKNIPASPDVGYEYLAYPKALRRLEQRLRATAEEMAAWIFMGPENGGIKAYVNANELMPPPRFYFDHGMGEDYLAPMMACWFLEGDIESFKPADRFITGKALIERWDKPLGVGATAFIQAKIEESRLIDLHPTYGGTRGATSEDDTFPPLEAGLFALAHVEAVEAEDFGCTVEPDRQHPPVNLPEQRRERLKARVERERRKGTKAFLKAVAAEEGISIPRLKQLIYKKSEPEESNRWTAMLGVPDRTSSKRPKPNS